MCLTVFRRISAAPRTPSRPVARFSNYSMAHGRRGRFDPVARRGTVRRSDRRCGRPDPVPNPAAEILLARREGIGNEGGFLAAGAATKALRGALRASARRETASYADRTLVAERGHGRRSLILHVIPVLDEERSTVLAVTRHRAVFVVDPEAGWTARSKCSAMPTADPSGAACLAAWQQATRRPNRRNAANRPADVRTHLQRLYQKTRRDVKPNS